MPILGMFFVLLFAALWIAWLFLLFRVIADVFRSDDLGGGAKALWLLGVIALPYLGTLVYVLARGDGMSKRAVERARESVEATNAYIRSVAGGGGTADELAKLAELRDRGLIDQADFESQKRKLLG